MSLTLTATGFESTITIGYGAFLMFRRSLAKAYSEKHGILYDMWIDRRGIGMPDDFDDNWNEDCDDDLDLLLWHSDCGGRLIPQECRKVYEAIERLKIDKQIFARDFEFYERFMDMLKHCYRHRVIMFFY